MVSLIQTDQGVVMVDLGWWSAGDRIRSELAGLGADTSDVIAVFLSHAHRDHIAGWPSVRHAIFYMAEAEVPYFFGEKEYKGWIPRLADRVIEPLNPVRGEVTVVTFSADTAIVVGRDTIHVFLVPGHTAGSTAYLVRGVLFAGDALSHTPVFGFRHSLPGYSDDVAQAELSLHSLVERLHAHHVRYICTAHAMCARYGATFLRDALSDPPTP
jgi:glyoxylase-like metal-dependent hydrolase (beta-lactamase superfamily II)